LSSGSWRSAPLYGQEILFFVEVASSHDKIAARCRSHKKKKSTSLTNPKSEFSIIRNLEATDEHDPSERGYPA
jgi:hypothetical protein